MNIQPDLKDTLQQKPNRLSRTFRLTQQNHTVKVESPQNQLSDFKTPTRIPRCRAGGGGGSFSGESPHNDSDFQQDIIWDATSPSPNRYGKRGRKQQAGVVNISEIVNRIAPKHGRPEVAEPTLQQWIGDSATIPCTPDVQGPKPKKKSPRPNRVDDLMKLAKQFDLNMFHQDEEEVEDQHQQSLVDIFKFENEYRPVVTPAAEKHMPVDDLDFLFDGPTQHVNGNLSQASSQVNPASGSSSKEASGKAPSHGSSAGVATRTEKDAFEDDWENDDLLNDSLVLEMTQNPQNFTSPKYCSTQKPSVIKSPIKVPVRGGLGQSAASKRERTTFKLESNPNFSVKRIQTETWTNFSSETQDMQQNRVSSSKSVLVKAGLQHTWRPPNPSTSESRKPSVEGSSAKCNSNTSASQTSHSTTPAVDGLLDDDLNAFFASEPVWDDPADDDMLCAMCDNLENQIQASENCSTKQTTVQPAIQKPSPQTVLPCSPGPPDLTLQAANFTAGIQTHTVRDTQPKSTSGTTSGSTCVSGRPFVRRLAANFTTCDVTNIPRATQAQSTSGSANSSTCVQGHTNKRVFTFKKPNNPVTMATTKVVAKCSAAEIELKKQQAMERRRQRQQATQNLRAPT